MSAILVAKKKRNDVTAKIDAEIMHMARIICAHRDGLPLAEYLSDLLLPLVTADYEEYRPAKPTKPSKRPTKTDESSD